MVNHDLDMLNLQIKQKLDWSHIEPETREVIRQIMQDVVNYLRKTSSQ